MVGQNIGKYRVLDRVGRGGMGTVYRAIDETLHREVAIKVLNAELNDPEVAKRFRAEAITVARLNHPGIATIYELFQYDGQWLMVMEFVRGETLERVVEQSGALAPDRAAEICMQCLGALAHAHSMGVVHRDLKPANIMLTEAGVIKIMDFGIARVAGTEHLTNVGFMMGTPAYMAPEQVLGHEIDARADLYALGVVLYRLLTGRLPFKGDTPFAMAQAQVNYPPTPVGTVRGDLPPWVDAVMERSLAKKPDDRFQSAVEFRESLGRCLAGLPMSAAYSSSAPTGLMSTPPHAVPTGSIERVVPVTATPVRTPSDGQDAGDSAAVLVAPEMAPTIATPTALARAAAMGGPDAGGAAEAGAPAPSGALAAVGPTVGAPAPAVGPPVETRSPRKIGMLPLAAGGLFVVLLAVAGLLWAHSRSAPQAAAPAVVGADQAPSDIALGPPSSDDASAGVPSADATASSPAADDSAAAGGGAAAGGAVATAAAAAANTPAARPSQPPAASAPSPSAADAAGRGAGSGAPPAGAVGAAGVLGGGRGAPVDDTHLAFADVKVLVVSGSKTKDQDVVLSFLNGRISVLNEKTGTPLAAMAYSSVAGATFTHARDPKWDSTLFSPPDDLDVGNMFRTPKDYLVLQGKTAYLILRLDDANWSKVLDAVEARTGITVSRPDSDDKSDDKKDTSQQDGK